MSDDAQANPGYALGQLARALRAGDERKTDAWVKVYEGMLSGALAIGSRTPMAAPAWATLEVVKGGFATGELVAAGHLRPQEEQLLARLGRTGGPSPRAVLNAHFLSEEGLRDLTARLADGRYRVEVPEEGALLVVAWLAANGHAEPARRILDAIGPFLGRLRFYPGLDEQPLLPGALVHVETVGRTITALEAIRPRREVLVERETLTVWHPLFDRLVALFLETVEGDWPCRRYPAGWNARARALRDELAAARAKHRLSGRPDRRGGHLRILREKLELCLAGRLTGRDVGWVRVVLAHAARRGLPGSEPHRLVREQQARAAALPTRDQLARVVAARLASRQHDAGLDAVEPAVAPVSAAEAARYGVPEETPLACFRERLLRCVDAPVRWHVDAGTIPSGEVLARVIPQLTSQVAAAGIEDPALRRLHGAIYAAFRRRRSLLLLNLESQVRLDELPWFAAIEPFRKQQAIEREVARRALEDVVLLALTAFPYAILPNKLLQEVRALAGRAVLDVPIVDEIAADIFMGEFTEKYLRAAQVAGRLLAGTLYETYYGIDYAAVAAIDDVKASRFGARTSDAFAALCAARAGGARGSVAANGKIIEQEQILTTHNLAVLVDALGLRPALEPRAVELARRCFAAVVRLAAQGKLRSVKNAAYAWRQMVFFLAIGPRRAADELLAEATDERLSPALAGLALAARGVTPTDGRDARRLLGWTTERHWLHG